MPDKQANPASDVLFTLLTIPDTVKWRLREEILRYGMGHNRAKNACGRCAE